MRSCTLKQRQICVPVSLMSLSSRRPRSFWLALRIATSGQAQWNSGSEWICKHIRIRPKPIKFVRRDSEHAQRPFKAEHSKPKTISFLESSFLSAHAGFTKRATLKRSVRGAVLIGCSKTMQMTGSNSETQYGRQKRQDDLLSSLVLIWQWMRLKVSTLLTFADQGPRGDQFYFSWRGLQDFNVTMINDEMSSKVCWSWSMPVLLRQDSEVAQQHNRRYWFGLKIANLIATVLHKNLYLMVCVKTTVIRFI